MFFEKYAGGRIGHEGSEHTENKSSEHEGSSIGKDLLVDAAETHILPVEARLIRTSEQEGAGPVGCA